MYIYQYSQLFFMNNSKAGRSQSKKKKLQMNKHLLKIRLLYNFDCIYHPILLSIQIQGGSLTCYFDEKHILKLFLLSSCQYVSIISGKNLHVTDLSETDIL